MKTLVLFLLAAFYSLVTLTPISAATGAGEIFDLSEDELRGIARAEDDYAFYVGDYIIRKSDVGALGAASGRPWSQGRFVFEFSAEVTAQQQQYFRDACSGWTIDTALQCVERTTETDYALVVTHNGDGCGGDAINVSCSELGMRGGRQLLQIYSGHWNLGTTSRTGLLQHEIGHALGLIHEHQRSDRSRYVTIIGSNVRPGQIGQFDPYSRSRNLTEYDYDSIMHYGNCTFASEPSKCRSTDPSTEAYWTIVPVPCARFEVGGDTITPLDLEGVRLTYGGPLMSVLRPARESSCGTLRYNRDQVRANCGENCSSASGIVWSRLYTKPESTCGFLARLDGPRFCAGRQQEFVAQWHDSDPGHIKCWGGTLNERWTQCGCSSQTLTAQCAQFDNRVVQSKLISLVNSINPEERAVGVFAQRNLQYVSKGYFAPQLEDILMRRIYEFSVRADTSTIADALCKIKIAITIRRLIDRDYRMTVGEFDRILAAVGASV